MALHIIYYLQIIYPMPLLEILAAPGIIIGMLLLQGLCAIGVNIHNICALDNGSATSTGERFFMHGGIVLFYGIIVYFLYRRR